MSASEQVFKKLQANVQYKCSNYCANYPASCKIVLPLTNHAKPNATKHTDSGMKIGQPALDKNPITTTEASITLPHILYTAFRLYFISVGKPSLIVNRNKEIHPSVIKRTPAEV